MEENTISYKLDRIKNATDRIRTKTGALSGTIEEVATSVEELPVINNPNKEITSNGIYNADEGYTGLGTVNVSVSPSVMEKNITSNGEFVSENDGVDGYNIVRVNVEPLLGTKTVTANGTYNAGDDMVQGYSSVTVNVPTGGGSSGDIMVFNTVEDMYAALESGPTMEIGQKTLVYAELEKHPTTDSVFQTLFFPENVTLSTAVTTSMPGEIRPVEGGGWYNYTFDLTATGLTARIEDDLGMGSVGYTSSDGITYTRTSYSYDNMGMGESLPYGTVKFMKPSKFSVLSTQLSEFFTVTSINFDGLYYMDEVRDGTRMITYTGEEYKLPYDIMNDIDIYSQWSKDSSIGLFMFDKVTKDLDIYDHNKFMIKDGAFYSIAPGGATAVRHLKYTYSTGKVFSETNVPISQEGEKIHDNFSDLVIGCIDDYNGVTFLDGNKSTIGTYTNGDEYTFPFKKKIFKNSNVGLATTPEYIYTGKKVYTDNGVITGALGTDNSFKNALLVNRLLIKYNLENSVSNSSRFSNQDVIDGEIPILKFLDISEATTFGYLFSSCSNLTNINIKDWDTSNIESMDGMFYGCKNLTSLDLSGWNTPKLKSIGYMFYNCTALTKLDIRNFDFSNIEVDQYASNYINAFSIIVKDDTQKTWITSKFSKLTNVKTIAEYEASL